MLSTLAGLAQHFFSNCPDAERGAVEENCSATSRPTALTSTMLPTSVLLRAKWKVPFFVPFPGLADAIKSNSPIRTTARNCTIMPFHVGATFLVHNGKDYLPVHVTPAHVGHKLGEFSHTKKPARHAPPKSRTG